MSEYAYNPRDKTLDKCKVMYMFVLSMYVLSGNTVIGSGNISYVFYCLDKSTVSTIYTQIYMYIYIYKHYLHVEMRITYRKVPPDYYAK